MPETTPEAMREALDLEAIEARATADRDASKALHLEADGLDDCGREIAKFYDDVIALTAALRCAWESNAELRKALERHHAWHQERERLEPEAEYSDSGLCEQTCEALSAARAEAAEAERDRLRDDCACLLNSQWSQIEMDLAAGRAAKIEVGFQAAQLRQAREALEPLAKVFQAQIDRGSEHRRKWNREMSGEWPIELTVKMDDGRNAIAALTTMSAEEAKDGE